MPKGRKKHMIKIVAKNYVKPECVQLFKDTARELIEKSRAEEGNIFYTLNVSKNDPNTLVFIEDWKDQAAIDFHNHTDHFLNILPKLAEMCNGEGDVELFEEV
jgi:PTH1 family peptidyl-tRNA hydrolase